VGRVASVYEAIGFAEIITCAAPGARTQPDTGGGTPTRTAETVADPPYDREREGDEWLDDFWVIALAGFASVIIILVMMMLLNGCVDPELNQPGPTLSPLIPPST
jgi:hypothetical protein